MVFHHPLYFGQTVSRTFFFYHFLPVFVWLFITSVKVVLQFAFDLTSDIDQPFYTSSGILDFVVIFGILFKFAILLLICVGALITNTAIVRLMFDSLPIQQHPKLRKNFYSFVNGVQSLTRCLGIHTSMSTFLFRLGIFIVGSLPMYVGYISYYHWHCDKCKWIDINYLPYEDIFVSLLSAMDIDTGSDSTDAATGEVSHPFSTSTTSSSSSHTNSFDNTFTCPSKSEQEFHCDSLLKFSLIWILVVWQWVIVMISVRTRPRVFGYVRGTDKLADEFEDDDMYTEKIRLQMMEERKQRVLCGLEDVLCDDVNWDYVVGDACYAGMILSTFYLVAGSFMSDRGIMYGIVTFLAVSSGQCFFYACVWFLLHLVKSMSDSLEYAWRTFHKIGERLSFPSLPHLIAGLTVLALSIIVQLTIIYYENKLVVVLVLYSFAVIFPTITFWLLKLQSLVPKLQLQSLPPPPSGLSRSSSAASVGAPTTTTTTTMITGAAGATTTTITTTMSGDESTDVDDDMHHLSPTSPPQSPISPRSTPPVSDHGYDGTDSSTYPSQSHSHSQSLSSCLCCRSRERGYSGQFVSPNIRYKVYIALIMILSLLFVVIIGAVVQRVVVSQDAVMPDVFYVETHSPPSPQYSSALSVKMNIRNHIFTSGTIMVKEQGNRSKEKEREKRRKGQSLNYCSHSVLSMSLIECALMTQLTYLPANSTDFDTFLHTMLDDFVLVNQSSPSSFSHSFSRPRVVFFEFFSPSRNLSVIAIRGTTAFEFSDWLADIDVWVEAVAFQFFEKFLPGLSLWPSTLRSQIIQLINTVVERFLPREKDPYMRHYHVPVLRHVQQMHPNDNVVLVGHSLGGGVAKIVAALTSNPGVSLSGPGIVESRGKLGVTIEQIDRHVVNIVPSGDVVSRVGKQGGTIINVPCRDNRPDSCHCPMAVVCELSDACGHPSIDIECKFHRHTSVPSSFYHTILNPKHT